MQSKKPSAISSKRRLLVVLLAAIAIMLGIAALRAIRPVAMPLAFAVLIAVLVNPLRSWLNRKLPQWLSLIIVLTVIMAVLGVLGGALAASIEQLEPQLPRYVDRLSQLWQTLSAQLSSWGIALNANAVPGGSWQNILERAIGSGRAVLGNLSLFALIISLLALLLLEVDEYGDRTQAAFSDSTSSRLIEAFSNMSKKLRQYFTVMTFTSVLTGVLTLLWCWILGVDLALIWALVAFVLNFIPTLGSIIAAILPALVALIIQGPAIGLATLIGLAAIQIIIGNFVDPRLQGKYLQISPFVALLSVVFWGWVWGIPGAFLGVPMTTAIILLSGEFRTTQPIAIMLGNRPL